MSLFLGDKVLWTFMQALAHHQAEIQPSQAIVILPPFQVIHLLGTTLPPQVTASSITRRQQAQDDIYLICELHGHWNLVRGLRNHQGQGLEWTLHDGL